MPREMGIRGSSRSRQNGRRLDSRAGFCRLLRDSQIFVSTMRETLDIKLLREVSSSQLTPSQFQILKLMSLDGQHQIGHVAEFLGISAPAATKNVDKLERLELITRAPRKDDRRATLLSVSPKGRRLVRKYERRKADLLSPVLERFQLAEVEQFSELLERFATLLLTLEPPDQRFCLRCGGSVEEDCVVGRALGTCRYREVCGA